MSLKCIGDIKYPIKNKGKKVSLIIKFAIIQSLLSHNAYVVELLGHTNFLYPCGPSIIKTIWVLTFNELM